jgi:RNA polymerase-binding transcription factor DksA
MSINKPSESEEEYFAREEAAKLYRATLDKRREMAKDEREALKAAHFMHCPKCGMELKSIRLRDVTVDRCFSCRGTWLDERELERLVGHEGPGLLERIAAVFRSDSSG